MPQFKSVQQLYFQSLKQVYQNLRTLYSSGLLLPSTIEYARTYYVSNLPAPIREHILKYALLKKENDNMDWIAPSKDRIRIEFVLTLIDLLADRSISNLTTISKDRYLFPEHYKTLISSLSDKHCIGLNSLRIRVHEDNSQEKESELVLATNFDFFYSLLARGLAKNLTVLELGGCCDNKILKIIGRQCKNLKKLNVSRSWVVDDEGFKNLCLKFPEKILKYPESENYDRKQIILSLMALKQDVLNPCCFSLYDVRLQETNTTDFTVLMLLILIKNLQTFGGFIYSRNVGDNILYLSQLAPEPLELKLTQLFDTNLCEQKVKQLTAIAPHITAMYTRSIHVQPILSMFQKLTEITIDFDYQPREDNFFQFLSVSGDKLKKIDLISKNGYLDASLVLQLCPNLQEFHGSVIIFDLNWDLSANSLKKAVIQVLDATIIQWMLRAAPNLENLVVTTLKPRNLTEYNTPFDNNILKNIIETKPPCLSTLKYFMAFTTYSQPISRKTIMKFIFACENLQYVGDLCTWNLKINEYKRLRNKLKAYNLDIRFLYDNVLSSDITMQSLMH